MIYLHIPLKIVESACKKVPGLCDSLFRVSSIRGDKLVISEAALDEVCRKHFSAFAPGEAFHRLAELVGVQQCDDCAARRIAWNTRLQK